MAYVAVPFPMTRYDNTGFPVTVTTVEMLQQLPPSFAPMPTTPAAIVAFPPSIIATVAQIPTAVVLPPVLTTLIALNKPKDRSRGRDN